MLTTVGRVWETGNLGRRLRWNFHGSFTWNSPTPGTRGRKFTWIWSPAMMVWSQQVTAGAIAQSVRAADS